MANFPRIIFVCLLVKSLMSLQPSDNQLGNSPDPRPAEVVEDKFSKGAKLDFDSVNLSPIDVKDFKQDGKFTASQNENSKNADDSFRFSNRKISVGKKDLVEMLRNQGAIQNNVGGGDFYYNLWHIGRNKLPFSFGDSDDTRLPFVLGTYQERSPHDPRYPRDLPNSRDLPNPRDPRDPRIKSRHRSRCRGHAVKKSLADFLKSLNNRKDD